MISEDYNESRVKQTFEEMKINGFRPARDLIFVRTNPMPTKTGTGIMLPPRAITLFGELPNLSAVSAVVIAVGPKAHCKPADGVVFLRTNFAWWMAMEDRTYVGWIPEEHLLGRYELSPGDTFADIRVEFHRRVR